MKHLLIIFIAISTLATIARAETKLNVLLIVADDLRTDLGCYGVADVSSPHIDALATQGIRFTLAYCQYPVCNPSRISFLTGLRPEQAGVLSNTMHFRQTLPDTVTLPQHFRDHGYFTASLGKIFHRGRTMEELMPEMDDPASWDVARYYQATPTGLKGKGRNLTEGVLPWCHWLAADGDDDDQPDGQIARDTLKMLEEHRDKLFFLAVGFHKPHDPFIAPRKYFDLYPFDMLTLEEDPPGQSAAPALALPDKKTREVFAKFTEREKLEFLRAYRAGTSFTDAQVGRVLDGLQRLGLADRTIVVFLSDHGYHLGERGWWNKNTLFENSARVPLLIRTPDTKPGVCRRPVELLDLYPTLIDLCNLPQPQHTLTGRSLRPLLADPSAPWDKPAITVARRGQSIGRSIRTDRWRYTEWSDGGAELYDHETDAAEDHNLAGDANAKSVIATLKPGLTGSP